MNIHACLCRSKLTFDLRHSTCFSIPAYNFTYSIIFLTQTCRSLWRYKRILASYSCRFYLPLNYLFELLITMKSQPCLFGYSLQSVFARLPSRQMSFSLPWKQNMQQTPVVTFRTIEFHTPLDMMRRGADSYGRILDVLACN